MSSSGSSLRSCSNISLSWLRRLRLLVTLSHRIWWLRENASTAFSVREQRFIAVPQTVLKVKECRQLCLALLLGNRVCYLDALL